jgi:hypothetical protein
MEINYIERLDYYYNSEMKYGATNMKTFLKSEESSH